MAEIDLTAGLQPRYGFPFLVEKNRELEAERDRLAAELAQEREANTALNATNHDLLDRIVAVQDVEQRIAGLEKNRDILQAALAQEQARVAEEIRKKKMAQTGELANFEALEKERARVAELEKINAEVADLGRDAYRQLQVERAKVARLRAWLRELMAPWHNAFGRRIPVPDNPTTEWPDPECNCRGCVAYRETHDGAALYEPDEVAETMEAVVEAASDFTRAASQGGSDIDRHNTFMALCIAVAAYIKAAGGDASG